jgi:hypothetical protein
MFKAKIMLKLMQNTLFDKTFRDSQGTLTIGQPPNLPLWTWITATFLKFIFTQGPVFEGLDAIAFGSLFTWAWLELFEGVNYFRRALGALVLIGAIVSRIHF